MLNGVINLLDFMFHVKPSHIVERKDELEQRNSLFHNQWPIQKEIIFISKNLSEMFHVKQYYRE